MKLLDEVDKGPSPRGRGNQDHVHLAQVELRSIPAWAGKPRWRCLHQQRTKVHPRVGGETLDLWIPVAVHEGPSPRGRGNPTCCQLQTSTAGSIPAWAGKPRFRQIGTYLYRVHPRVGGETLICGSTMIRSPGPSPRGRGNLCAGFVQISRQRSIPAWAGKPRDRRRGHRESRVHPRVGGETSTREPMRMAV